MYGYCNPWQIEFEVKWAGSHQWQSCKEIQTNYIAFLNDVIAYCPRAASARPYLQPDN